MLPLKFSYSLIYEAHCDRGNLRYISHLEGGSKFFKIVMSLFEGGKVTLGDMGEGRVKNPEKMSDVI